MSDQLYEYDDRSSTSRIRNFGHGGEHDPHQQHHFTTMEWEQFDTSKDWYVAVPGHWRILTFGGLEVRRLSRG